MRPRLGPVGADLLIVAGLLVVGVFQWQGGEAGWPTLQDQLLDGMDAGEWADQMRAWTQGRPDDLDGHRMPTWTLLVGLLAPLNVGLAGHLVNHLLQLALGPIVYGLGRVTGMGRGSAAVAGAWVAANAVLVLASRRFGVDPTIATFIPLALLAAHLTRWRWWLAPLAGAVSALTAAAHFTTLPIPIPAFALAILVAKPGERAMAGIGFLAGLALTWGMIFQAFPWIGWETLVASVGESASHPAAGGAGAPGWERMLSSGWLSARTHLGGALSDYAGRMHAFGIPLLAAVGLAVLGAAGVGLGGQARPAAARRGARVLESPGATPGWGGGLGLALALAPVPVLLAMQAAPRYSDNLLPLAILLVVRGLAVCVGFAERWGGPRCDAVFGVLGGIWAVSGTATGVPAAPMSSALLDREVGAMLAANAPPGSCVVSSLRDAVAYAGLRFVRIGCPTSTTQDSFRDCLSTLQRQCRDQDSVGWIIVERTPLDERSAARRAMDDWAKAEFGVIAEALTPTETVSLVRLPFSP